ncbi:hypothetical protein BGZ94_002634 [Podila epigama]|nr:hypothetical protein BGZ94_002634 [Podila epigama]
MPHLKDLFETNQPLAISITLDQFIFLQVSIPDNTRPRSLPLSRTPLDAKSHDNNNNPVDHSQDWWSLMRGICFCVDKLMQDHEQDEIISIRKRKVFEQALKETEQESVVGETTAFHVDIKQSKTVSHLKDNIKDKKANRFSKIDADQLILWKATIHDAKPDSVIMLETLKTHEDATELNDARIILSTLFPNNPNDNTYIFVQLPEIDNRTHNLHADITKITDKFFAPGSDVEKFLSAFVQGTGQLPTTTGNIQGLPRAWRRGLGKAPTSRPSLLFLDLPDPSVPDSTTRNLAAGSILELIQQDNRYNIPIFGVSGCGKTRAMIELLSQRWGFYFNAADDDWGSGDMMTLFNTVRDHLTEVETNTTTVDHEMNNIFARKMTLLLFLSRILILKNCLNINGSSEAFNSARWTLLQLCPHVLFKDIFNILYLKLINFRYHSVLDLHDFVGKVYEDTKNRLIQRGCLPKIKDSSKLLVINDGAQFLGDQFNGSFKSSSSMFSPRPVLSPVLHAFRSIGDHELTLVTCGTGLSINTLYWVQSSGSGLKDSSNTFDYMEFPGWESKESIESYISQVRTCLPHKQSRQAFAQRLPQDAIDMLFVKFEGRYRPAIVAIERIIECDDPGTWKKNILDVEERLVSWENRHIKGNLCYEISRLHDKHNKFKDKVVESIDSMLLMYQRYEPFVSKAVENYFAATDLYFAREVQKRMIRATLYEQGCVFEQFMMTVFSETLNKRPLSEWWHQPPIAEMCPALVGKVEIVGWREPGLEQGTTHATMSMQEFMDAHVNHASMHNDMSVAPFFFPKTKPSGPDMVFFVRIDGVRLVPVFVQMKLHQRSSNFSEKDWTDALSTVSAPNIEGHVRLFREYCPENVYISVIVAYPTKWTEKLPASSELPQDTSGVQQVVINISDDNFGDIFPKEHVKFIDRLKNGRKRPAVDSALGDSDSRDEDDPKK